MLSRSLTLAHLKFYVAGVAHGSCVQRMALPGFRNGCGQFTCDGDIAGRDLKAETRDKGHFATQRRIIDVRESRAGLAVIARDW